MRRLVASRGASMSDERWLSKGERGTWDRKWPTTASVADLLDHAEAADELIAELARCLCDYIESDIEMDCVHLNDGPEVLARVDALTKDTE